jgi:hypothetical protein
LRVACFLFISMNCLFRMHGRIGLAYRLAPRAARRNKCATWQIALVAAGRSLQSASLSAPYPAGSR